MRAPQFPWLDPVEQERLAIFLLERQLLKYSNARNLPLKSGGETDIYINLRDARNHPEAIRFLSKTFEDPLRRLNPDRFIEIPDAVSCFAGPLSVATNIPYITVRERPKEGRATKATAIGTAPFGAKAVILDDVVTDGESKIAPFREAKALGLNPECLLVLVDRQQGWKKKFAEHGIDLPVWAGMTLHDMRRILISKLGVMERCSREAEEKNCIIVALDGKSREETFGIVDPLRPLGAILKVNDLLFAYGTANLVAELQVYGRVMVDLKYHDIPNTVQNTCKRLRENPPWAITLHASGGGEMIKAAVKELEGTPTKVLAVTVLTSHSAETCEDIYHRLPSEQVKDLARIAAAAGAHGFVCSPQESKELKSLYPEKITVTPGIRSDGAPKNDQARIATPRGARENGADFLVMGRQILEAKSPVAEFQRILKEELAS